MVSERKVTERRGKWWGKVREKRGKTGERVKEKWDKEMKGNWKTEGKVRHTEDKLTEKGGVGEIKVMEK